MTDENHELISNKLKEVGISLDCWSPLEISSGDAQASGWFAQVVIEAAMNGEFDD